jgi:hypothetical protein
MRWLTERAITMSQDIKAKIKDRDQFRQVYSIPVDGEDVPGVGKFILSIIGQTIPVRKLRSRTGSFYYISDLDSRWVIMPNWIASFDTDSLLPTHTTSDSSVVPLVLEDGTVVIMGR